MADNRILAGLVNTYGAIAVFDAAFQALGFPATLVNGTAEAMAISKILEVKE